MSEQKSLIEKLYDFSVKMEGIEIIKGREAYGYNYADLPSIKKIIDPVLRDVGVWYFHRTEVTDDGDNIVITVVYSVGNTADRIPATSIIPKDTVLAKMNKLMVIGSGITYYRRYHLVTILGLTTDEDSDAGGARPTAQKPGRSVESDATSSEPDYISIFKGLVKNKPKDSVIKTLDVYKKMISNKDLKEIEELIKNTYENK